MLDIVIQLLPYNGPPTTIN